MIIKYVTDIAHQMDVKLSTVFVEDGIGQFPGVFLLHLGTDGQLVRTMVYQSDLDELKSCSSCDRLEVKLRKELTKLQKLIAS